MKKTNYVTPKARMIALQKNDILTASTDAFDGQWVPIVRDASDADDIPTA